MNDDYSKTKGKSLDPRAGLWLSVTVPTLRWEFWPNYMATGLTFMFYITEYDMF